MESYKIDEDNIVVDGVRLVANVSPGCDGCFFKGTECYKSFDIKAKCGTATRGFGKSIIWVKQDEDDKLTFTTACLPESLDKGVFYNKHSMLRRDEDTYWRLFRVVDYYFEFIDSAKSLKEAEKTLGVKIVVKE